MIIYLIGPSGVGKTSCACHAASMLKAEYRNLDKLCTGQQFNWNVCRHSLDSIESESRLNNAFYMVDIGAGTQCLPDLLQYLIPRRQRVILIWAPPSEVIRRNPLGANRSREEYGRTEYISRKNLYSLAMHKLDVSCMSQDEENAHFMDYVCKTFNITAQQL
jgi:hypothetical protein